MKKVEINIKVPTREEDISLRQYQNYMEYKNVVKDVKVPELEKQMRLISIFCDIKYDVVKSSMELGTIQIISSTIGLLVKAIEEEGEESTKEFSPFVTIAGVKCGFVPEFEKMTGGEFADLSTHITEWPTMHKAMAVLFRPIIEKRRNLLLRITQYRVSDYSGTTEYAEAMKEMPAIKVLQTLTFIESSYQNCADIFLTYTQNLLKKTPLKANNRFTDSNKPFTTTGDGINHSMP